MIPESAATIATTTTRRFAVIGGSGFVGTGIVNTLNNSGAQDVAIPKGPRLRYSGGLTADEIIAAIYSDDGLQEVVRDLSEVLRGVSVVINAAGIASPDASMSDELLGANALLPVVIAEAAAIAGVKRFIHLSSAAVQGRRERLDESHNTAPFSAYSESKALGEQVISLWRIHHYQDGTRKTKTEPVIVRATSVQGVGRGTSKSLSKVASSPIASVAAPGSQPSAVSSLTGLAKFVVAISDYAKALPEILLQPWEGASANDVLELSSGGRRPRKIPASLAKITVKSLYAFSHRVPKLTGLTRRVEVMWLGQDQIVGWGASHGLADGISLEGIGPDVSVSTLRQLGPSDDLRHALRCS